MSHKQHEEYLLQRAEALDDAAHFKGMADEFLRDLVPQLSTPQLEWFCHEIEVELREREQKRSFGCPF